MAAALRALALWAVAAGTLWLHALMGIPGDYLGQGYPLYPGLKVTLASLALEATLGAVPVLALAALALWRHLRLAVLPGVAALWLWAATGMVHPFIIDFGTTWSGTEVLRELVLHRVHTPIALIVVLVAGYVLLAPRGRAR